MIISAELIAIGIFCVALVSFGWKVSSDIRQEFRLEIQHVREDVAHVRGDVARVRGDVSDLRGDVADLRERMARLEGLFEGFTRGELAEQKK
ncbi:MAG: hypothetical protein OXI69_01225 [Acidobacteriota bacterium]|nr:hypothetical protein [Acidobacteriota bacterium]